MEKKSVKKIAIIGAESTGKSWLCEQLAERCRTVWVPEYAREYFNNSDIYNYSLHDLELIAEKQLQMEEEHMLRADRFLFCDTAMITLKIWAELEFGAPSAKLQQLIQAGSYDYYFVTDNSVPWQEDPLRQNKFNRELIMQMNVKEAEVSGVPYNIVTGTETGLKNIVKLLAEL